MKRVLELADPILAGHLHALLEEAGIACQLRNHFLAGAAGELPPNECWPEIWVLEDGHAERARSILDEHLNKETGSTPGWLCNGCGEALEAQFTTCWRCGQGQV